jgi:hypothetical protein
MMINFATNKVDSKLIKAIAERACLMATQLGDEYELLDAEMDITAVHANGCRLQLKELRNADDFNFGHDIFGIRQHLNRATGQLEHHFWPRFAER